MWKDTVQQLNDKTKNSVQVSSLQWIFRHAITNSDTQKIVNEAYTAIGKDRSKKHVWSPKDKDVPGGGNAFYALLGSENGKGPTRMFTDYHNALWQQETHKYHDDQSARWLLRLYLLHQV